MSLIYVLEDDSNIREIEEYALNASSYEVKGFETAAAFRRELRQQVPDLVLLDIMLPDADGNDVLEEIRRNPETAGLPVIMVTAKSTELDKVRGLDLGADDYLTKPFGVLELISRVKARLRRSEAGGQMLSASPMSGNVTNAVPPATAVSGSESSEPASEEKDQDEKKHLEAGGIVLDDSRYEVSSDGKPVHLTYKEYSLLRLLLDRKDTAVTRDEILEIVWNTDFAGESRTLDMHIRSLRRKLGPEGSRIRTLRNIGYMLDSTRKQSGGEAAG